MQSDNATSDLELPHEFVEMTYDHESVDGGMSTWTKIGIIAGIAVL